MRCGCLGISRYSAGTTDPTAWRKTYLSCPLRILNRSSIVNAVRASGTSKQGEVYATPLAPNVRSNLPVSYDAEGW